MEYFIIAHSVHKNYNTTFLLDRLVMYYVVCIGQQHILTPPKHVMFNLLISGCRNSNPSLGCPQNPSAFAAHASGISSVGNYDFFIVRHYPQEVT